MKPDSNRLMTIDAVAVLIISIAICTVSHKLWLMSLLVPAVIAARFAILSKIAKVQGVNIPAETAFFVVCTIIGAFNDWNSVTNKTIYHYSVPHFFDFSTIPLWMSLYWGMILRSLARFARWEFLYPDHDVSNNVAMGKRIIESPALKVAIELTLVLLSRQAVYRYYEHPLLSWLPFMVALIMAIIIFKPNSHDWKLLGIFFIVGPLIEIAYIKIGRLHYYELDWVAGVPVWIILWWLLAILIWKDIAFRIEKLIKRLIKGVNCPADF